METKKQTTSFTIKTIRTIIRENRIPFGSFILTIVLLIRWYFDKQIKLNFRKTKKNLKIMSQISEILNNYSPTFWLPGQYLKECFFSNLKTPYLVDFDRIIFKTIDNEKIASDFYPKNHERLPEETPTVVFIPSAFNDSRNSYCKEFCKKVWTQLSWRSCIFNRRGYSNMPITVRTNFFFS